MADIENLKALAEAANAVIGDVRIHADMESQMGSKEEAEAVMGFMVAANPAAVLGLIAELKELRRRAAYWKQRAKSAEGHLYAGDMKAAMRELHKRTTHAGTPWEDLSVSQHAQIQGAALAVVGAINYRRDRRLPADSQETARD